MKRLVLLAAAFGVAAGANAADDVEMKHSGEFRLRYVNEMNPSGVKDAKDSSANFTHRFKWNITARKGENLQAFLGLLHGADWGVDAGDGSTNPGVANDDAQLVVNRAWGWWKTSDALSFKFGRMGLEIADGSFFSENDWEAVPTAHEGVVGMWDMDFAKISLFGLKTDEFGYQLGGARTADAERNMYGVSLDFKNMPEAIKMANLLVMQEMRDETGAAVGTGATNAQRIGVTVGGDASNIMYKATLGFRMGKSKDRTTPVTYDLNSNMYDLMVGYSMPETMGLKISAGYHMDSGDKTSSATKNEAWDPGYYDVHNYAGLMDVVGWGNLTYWNLAVSMMPTDSIEAGLAYYMFSKSESTGNINLLDLQSNASGNTFFNGGGVAGATDKDIGSELDVYANKSYDGGFKIGARYGMFMPGKSLKDLAPKRDQTASQLFLQASMSF
ncbi:MAG: alginate export family protein [Bdellovibrionaceae bacterium]|nr:alginate export family protein [Pseudobdellovibrionaceae bacterium]